MKYTEVTSDIRFILTSSSLSTFNSIAISIVLDMKISHQRFWKKLVVYDNLIVNNQELTMEKIKKSELKMYLMRQML